MVDSDQLASASTTLYFLFVAAVFVVPAGAAAADAADPLAAMGVAVGLGTALMAAGKAVVYVPTGEQRGLLAGREYRRTLDPGFHLVRPFVDRQYPLDGHQPVPLGTVTVGDGEDALDVTVAAHWRITDPAAAFAESPDPRHAIYDAGVAARDEHLDGAGPHEVRRDPAALADAIERDLATEAGRWGVIVESVDLSVEGA